MDRLKLGDTVIVIAGKDRGKQGELKQKMKSGKVVVEGINLVKKHVKPNPNTGVTGGIIDKEMPIDASNIALLNPANGKGDKVGFKIQDDGTKVRIFKSNGEVVGK